MTHQKKSRRPELWQTRNYRDWIVNHTESGLAAPSAPRIVTARVDPDSRPVGLVYCKYSTAYKEIRNV
jgi:hypothetical protein